MLGEVRHATVLGSSTIMMPSYVKTIVRTTLLNNAYYCFLSLCLPTLWRFNFDCFILQHIFEPDLMQISRPWRPMATYVVCRPGDLDLTSVALFAKDFPKSPFTFCVSSELNERPRLFALT